MMGVISLLCVIFVSTGDLYATRKEGGGPYWRSKETWEVGVKTGRPGSFGRPERVRVWKGL